MTASPEPTLPPLSLYIHFPWCIRKCPYCDFNSHALRHDDLPEQHYINALLQDLQTDLAIMSPRPIQSIFMGGGTPSLFSAAALDRLLTALNDQLSFAPAIEITLEANPGSIEAAKFADYRRVGINRLSIGIQSFADHQLKQLGRIHDSAQAQRALEIAHQAGFDNFNIDIMYGLPKQTLQQALDDLQTGLRFQPKHLSWYQLTIEPNTVFHKTQPVLPHDDHIIAMENAGRALLADQGLQRYEVSAYAQDDFHCRHNMNYWQFGDYLGIGAGAHAKITTDNGVMRLQKRRQPSDYLHPEKSFIAKQHIIENHELPFEFMLNALRLSQSFSLDLFTQRTGQSLHVIEEPLTQAQQSGLINIDAHNTLHITPLGQQFLNDLQGLFLR